MYRETSFSVSEDDIGTRLDVFLARCSGLSRTRVKKLIDEGYAVFPNGTVLKPSYHIENEDIIEFTVPQLPEPEFLPEQIPLDIVFQDKHLIVVNKPPGMVVHPGRGNISGTLASALLYHCDKLSTAAGVFRPGIVHRLDKDTSGLIVAALNDKVHWLLADMIHDRKVHKGYTAFVWGHPQPETGTVDAPVGRNPKKRTIQAVVENGRKAVTQYATVERFDFVTKLAITLLTGRTHQIRVHMAYMGHHIFGDPSYGGRKERLKGFSPEIRVFARELLARLKRQALHAGKLEFKHPVTGENLTFEAPFPNDLKIFEEELRERQRR